LRNGAPIAAGVAHRHHGAELWVHDMDGRPLRPVTLAQAELLVSEGAAYPIVAAAGWKQVRLKAVMPPNSLQTFYGRQPRRGGTVSKYHHNSAACRTWNH
jgi:hypothetical protein